MTGIRGWGELKRSPEVLVIFLSNGHNLWWLNLLVSWVHLMMGSKFREMQNQINPE